MRGPNLPRRLCRWLSLLWSVENHAAEAGTSLLHSAVSRLCSWEHSDTGSSLRRHVGLAGSLLRACRCAAAPLRSAVLPPNPSLRPGLMQLRRGRGLPGGQASPAQRLGRARDNPVMLTRGIASSSTRFWLLNAGEKRWCLAASCCGSSAELLGRGARSGGSGRLPGLDVGAAERTRSRRLGSCARNPELLPAGLASGRGWDQKLPLVTASQGASPKEREKD